MRSRTKCASDCKGVIVDKAAGVYCQCIEAKLPKPSKQSSQAYAVGVPTGSIDFTSLLATANVDKLEASLRQVLDPYEVELVVLRYIEGKTFQQIMKKQGWVSASSASHHLKQTLKKLREMSFTV